MRTSQTGGAMQDTKEDGRAVNRLNQGCISVE